MNRSLRILHLPVNNALRTSHTVRALRQRGVDARGLVRTRIYGRSPAALKIIDLGSRLGSRYSPHLLWQAFPWLHNFLKYVRWADALHWYHGALALPFGLDLALVKYLRKLALVKWQGADIRVPEVEFAEHGRDDAMQLMAGADMFLDQFVLGDFGVAALEAMALGKPVVCYIKPSLAAEYPADLPIVKATRETLTETLRQLLTNPGWR